MKKSHLSLRLSSQYNIMIKLGWTQVHEDTANLLSWGYWCQYQSRNPPHTPAKNTVKILASSDIASSSAVAVDVPDAVLPLILQLLLLVLNQLIHFSLTWVGHAPMRKRYLWIRFLVQMSLLTWTKRSPMPIWTISQTEFLPTLQLRILWKS